MLRTTAKEKSLQSSRANWIRFDGASEIKNNTIFMQV